MSNTTTIFSTIPPTQVDLHYWLFGILVMFAVGALFCGILATRQNIEVGSDTFIITALIGLFTGSVIALLMNIIPWFVSVGMFTLLVIYFWRGRG